MLQLAHASRDAFAAGIQYHRLCLQEIEMMRIMVTDEYEEAEALLKAADCQIGQVKHSLNCEGRGAFNISIKIVPPNDNNSKDTDYYSGADSTGGDRSPVPEFSVPRPSDPKISNPKASVLSQSSMKAPQPAWVWKDSVHSLLQGPSGNMQHRGHFFSDLDIHQQMFTSGVDHIYSPTPFQWAPAQAFPRHASQSQGKLTTILLEIESPLCDVHFVHFGAIPSVVESLLRLPTALSNKFQPIPFHGSYEDTTVSVNATNFEPEEQDIFTQAGEQYIHQPQVYPYQSQVHAIPPTVPPHYTEPYQVGSSLVNLPLPFQNSVEYMQHEYTIPQPPMDPLTAIVETENRLRAAATMIQVTGKELGVLTSLSRTTSIHTPSQLSICDTDDPPKCCAPHSTHKKHIDTACLAWYSKDVQEVLNQKSRTAWKTTVWESLMLANAALDANVEMMMEIETLNSVKCMRWSSLEQRTIAFLQILQHMWNGKLPKYNC
ncbi:hypothetical protein BKA83DRAFT_4588979 [Pisolithus microcarpus]|nr:hypothetical protein BKA83DRAFT_4588979 [Pisolithus microcarpus]